MYKQDGQVFGKFVIPGQCRERQSRWVNCMKGSVAATMGESGGGGQEAAVLEGGRMQQW